MHNVLHHSFHTLLDSRDHLDMSDSPATEILLRWGFRHVDTHADGDMQSCVWWKRKSHRSGSKIEFVLAYLHVNNRTEPQKREVKLNWEMTVDNMIWNKRNERDEETKWSLLKDESRPPQFVRFPIADHTDELPNEQVDGKEIQWTVQLMIVAVVAIQQPPNSDRHCDWTNREKQWTTVE